MAQGGRVSGSTRGVVWQERRTLFVGARMMQEDIKDEHIKKLTQTIGEPVLDSDILREAMKPVYPCGPDDIQRVIVGCRMSRRESS